MNFKYVRIQGQELAEDSADAKGVFSMCWQLAKHDRMSKEDTALYKKLDTWFEENLPLPAPCTRQERVVCFFKAENTREMMQIIRPALWLVDRYRHPYYLVYSNMPGKIVYEDAYQVAVRVPDFRQLDELQEDFEPLPTT